MQTMSILSDSTNYPVSPRRSSYLDWKAPSSLVFSFRFNSKLFPIYPSGTCKVSLLFLILQSVIDSNPANKNCKQDEDVDTVQAFERMKRALVY